MNQLEQKTITSLEVAEMMEVKHYQILEKLEGTKTVKGIIPTMTNHNFMVSDYFIESTYTDGSGKENKCYLVTKLGCDFLANKFTGEKGIIFTAKYVKRFRDMEETIQSGLIDTSSLSSELQAIISHDKKLQIIVQHLDNQDSRMDKLEYDIPLYGCESKELSDHVKRKGVNVLGGKKSNAYNDGAIRTAVYRDIYDQVKREFGLYDESGKKQTYLALKRKHLADAHECIDAYQPPMYLQEQIEDANARIELAQKEGQAYVDIKEKMDSFS